MNSHIIIKQSDVPLKGHQGKVGAVNVFDLQRAFEGAGFIQRGSIAGRFNIVSYTAGSELKLHSHPKAQIKIILNEGGIVQIDDTGPIAHGDIAYTHPHVYYSGKIITDTIMVIVTLDEPKIW